MARRKCTNRADNTFDMSQGHGGAFPATRPSVVRDLGSVDPLRRAAAYEALARETGLRVTDVTNELAWARRAFRDIVLTRLREVCASDDEFRAEARDLLGVEPS